MRLGSYSPAALTLLSGSTSNHKGNETMKLKQVKIWLCQGCLDGDGEECHTPGCALYLHKVDLPIMPELYEVLAEVTEPIE